MRHTRSWILLTFLLSSIDLYADDQALAAEARQWVITFAGELKPRLQQAMAEGGPVHAIAVCSQAAPDIATRLSQTSGWRIRRVSLKPRNVASATPDAWERKILQQFERELADGKPAAGLYHAERVGGDFRYMQAQPVEAICLTCHGENLAPEVVKQLQRYPGDTATGYRPGQIRGAFSLIKTAATN